MSAPPAPSPSHPQPAPKQSVGQVILRTVAVLLAVLMVLFVTIMGEEDVQTIVLTLGLAGVFGLYGIGGPALLGRLGLGGLNE